VFSKGRELYGLFEARSALREHGYALVTEGYMDVVALAQLGFANAVATLGTACTAEHVQKLFRFTDAVVFSFDGDSAGRRAARKALEAALPFASDVRSVKFLFLPAEHDPDSYIREHGTEGFATMVKQAVPLSRFMLEAASEACDMLTAEGRAHMASNARVLWSLLPDGALKRQLLAEIADQVQIDSRELLQLWQPAASYQGKARGGRSAGTGGFKPGAGHAPARNATSQAPDDYPDYPGRDDGDYASSEPYLDSNSGSAGGPSPEAWAGRKGRFGADTASSSRPRRLAGRILPASREDRVLRTLLTEPQAWDKLSPDEHALLSGLPAPHGPLFVWLESQLHEHGPQPWAALREGLREHSHENYAVSQLAQIPEGIESDWDEVRSILTQLSRVARDAEMQDLALRAPGDPAAMARYRELAAQQKPR
jgi:DNA primase